MAQHDWSRFRVRVTVNAGIQIVYNAWTKQSGLEQWFLRKAEFTTTDGTPRNRDSHIQKGDTYTWLWFGYGDDVVERGKVLGVNGKDSLQFTFSAGTTVSVSIKVEEGETIVELLQENIPLDEKSRVDYYVGCMKGWTFYLANLKSVLEGGIDLRNRNVRVSSVVNA
jgi:uncharacterized protein YndB with AHSA1/START domain